MFSFTKASDPSCRKSESIIPLTVLFASPPVTERSTPYSSPIYFSCSSLFTSLSVARSHFPQICSTLISQVPWPRPCPPVPKPPLGRTSTAKNLTCALQTFPASKILLLKNHICFPRFVLSFFRFFTLNTAIIAAIIFCTSGDTPGTQPLEVGLNELVPPAYPNVPTPPAGHGPFPAFPNNPPPPGAACPFPIPGGNENSGVLVGLGPIPQQR